MYGPFNDYDTYKRALQKWTGSATERNRRYFKDFSEELGEKIKEVYDFYYENYGCKFSKRDINAALRTFLKEPDPFEFGDLISNEEDFEKYDYYEESSNNGLKNLNLHKHMRF